MKCRSKKWELLKTEVITSWTTLFTPSTVEMRARPLSDFEMSKPSPKTDLRYATLGSRFLVRDSIFNNGCGTKPKSLNCSVTYDEHKTLGYSLCKSISYYCTETRILLFQWYTVSQTWVRNQEPIEANLFVRLAAEPYPAYTLSPAYFWYYNRTLASSYLNLRKEKCFNNLPSTCCFILCKVKALIWQSECSKLRLIV